MVITYSKPVNRLVGFVVYFLLGSITLFQNNEEMMVYAPNVALKKPTQIGFDHTSHKSHTFVDSIQTDNWYESTQTTKAKVTWWVVDLLAVYKIHSLAVLNRNTQGKRLQNFTVDIFMTDPRKQNLRMPHSGLKCNSGSLIQQFVKGIKRGFIHLTPDCGSCTLLADLPSTKSAGRGMCVSVCIPN